MLLLRTRVELGAIATHSSKVQHYWNLTIKLFSAIYRKLVGEGSYSFVKVQSDSSDRKKREFWWKRMTQKQLNIKKKENFWLKDKKTERKKKVKIERLFQAVALSVLLYNCTIWTFTTRLEKKGEIRKNKKMFERREEEK